MTEEPVLYSQRVDELTRLIDAHLERGALDEGNATAFDGIIDAWLAEEIARLDHAVTASATAAMANAAAAKADAAAAEAERQRRYERERAAEEQRQAESDRDRQARQRVYDAQMARHDARLRAAEGRLEAARAQLTSARELLLGTGPVKEPVETRDQDADESDAAPFVEDTAA